MIDWRDTIVGSATPDGEGVWSILRLTGPKAHEIARSMVEPEIDGPGSAESLARVTPPIAEAASAAARIRVDAWDRAAPGRILVWPEGRSATGQPAAELHAPASAPLAQALMTAIVSKGARLARPGEFTLRAFLAGKVDLTQAEAILGVIDADNIDDLKVALDQRSGGLSRPIAQLRGDLLDLLADLEAGLDFVEEDIQFVDDAAVASRLSAAFAEVERLRDAIGLRGVARALPRVALVGPPNAGKSSLFNALLGRAAALVSEQSGTTRDYLSGELMIGAVRLELIDSAGLEPEDSLAGGDQRSVTARIQEKAADLRDEQIRLADLVLVCRTVEDESNWPHGDRARRLFLRTKHDLEPASFDHRADLHVSVKHPRSLLALKGALANRLSRLAAERPMRRANERVATALAAAADRLNAARDDLASRRGHEVVAMALREALDRLGEVVGAVFTDDLLDRVFSRFCIGK